MKEDAGMKAWHKASLADIEWQTPDGFPDVQMKFLGESLEHGPHVLLVRHPPEYVEPKHWHEADTVYIFTSGEMRVEGEASYRPGDVRWVRAGTYYGPETAGPDGCEFFLIGAGGSPLMHFEPPNG
jgi:hypothetical protein